MIPRPQLPPFAFVTLTLTLFVLAIAAFWRYIAFALICMALVAAVRRMGHKWNEGGTDDR